MAKPTREPEESVCVFSEEQPSPLYRYTLEHHWGHPGDQRAQVAVWCMLNPSTADNRQLDPTLRRCKGFSRAWGFTGMVIVNLYAFRATEPRDMLRAADPVGPLNDTHLLRVANRSDVGMIIAGWGCHGTHLGRDAAVKALLKGRLHTLRLTKEGHPSHPLYLPQTLRPIPFA